MKKNENKTMIQKQKQKYKNEMLVERKNKCCQPPYVKLIIL